MKIDKTKKIKKRGKKNLGILVAFFLLVLPLASSLEFFVYTDPYSEDLRVTGINVLEQNSFYLNEFVVGDAFTDKTVSLLDSSDNILSTSKMGESVTFLPFSPRASKIVISDSGSDLWSSDFSLCDNDGVCEPCDSAYCENLENFFTCSDCASGSFDDVCDMRLDGFCDPDCGGWEADCTACEPFCTYHGASCSDLGGSLCSSEDDCIGGYFVGNLLVDGGLVENCCVGGSCGNLAEHLETQRQISLHPEYFNLTDDEPVPLGSCSDRGGVLCSFEQGCDDEWDFFMSGDGSYGEEDGLCCLGSCVDPDPEPVDEPELLSDEYVKSVLEEEIGVEGKVSEFKLPRELPPGRELELSAEEIERFESGEIVFSEDGSVYVEAESGLDPDEVASEIEFRAEKDSVDFFPEMKAVDEEVVVEQQALERRQSLLGFSPLTFFISLGGVILLVASFILFFYYKEHKTPSPAVSQHADLQAHIDSMLSKSMDYRSIQKALISKGFGPQLVHDEIKKNYYSHKRDEGERGGSRDA